MQLVISIEGEIGAGKSCLIDLLARAFEKRGHSVVTVDEPVNDWLANGVLQNYYENPTDPATIFELQTYTLLTRVEALERSSRLHPHASVILLERSIASDRYIFMHILKDIVGERRLAMYERAYDLWNRLMPIKPNHLVWLKPSLETCMARVQARSRKCELPIVSIEYQERLRQAHHDYFANHVNCPVTIIEPDLADMEFDHTIVDKIMAQICQ